MQEVCMSSGEGLPECVRVLDFQHPCIGRSKIYVIGTAHISAKSVDDVRRIIKQVKPGCVVVELCKSRVGMLQTVQVKVPTLQEMIDSVRRQGMPVWGVVYGWASAQLALQIDFIPGQEFRAAVEEAKECGAKIMLGDRPLQATLKRTWGGLSVREKVRFLWSLFGMGAFAVDPKELLEYVESLKDADLLTEAIKQVAVEFPSLSRTLIEERDLYLINSFRKAAKHSTTVVAVVGAGHVPGICRNWDAEIDAEKLLELPSEDEPSLLRAAAWEWRWELVTVATVVITTSVTCIVTLRRRSS
ncbi:hypothetical protein CYMTET_37112 [Cymbomonas tetramitiformis]|uniref:Uncharacterized protein n=1 Tax=Cymbomonas tetramitiformis TaxID=36881 RepID=A0AAE0F6J9_9CHLO|nr:hypothetical protein CYMTET_37112 [Cymbomonas tetramitiformis]